MLINGPPIVNSTARTDDANLSLRVNQRLVAEVLKISGDSVTLSIEGVHIVARLSSQDQAAALQEHRIAQFVIRDLSSNNILLQLVSPATIIPNWSEGESNDLAGVLLKAAGILPTPENVTLLRAMLSQGMNADPDVFVELRAVLQQLGSWGEEEAGIAAALKKAGLPVSPEIIKLVKESGAGLSGSVSQLIDQLQTLSKQAQYPQLAQSARAVLDFLRSITLPWDAPSPALAEKLSTTVSLIGRSLENQLSRMAGAAPAESASTLNQIAALRQELAHAGLYSIIDDLDQLLENMRFIHLLNSNTGAQTAQERWASLEIPLRLAANSGQPISDPSGRWYDASLKIAYEKNGEAYSINPEFTQLIIQLNLEKNDMIEVTLSIAGRKVSAQVSATSKELKNLSEQEMSGLASGLAEIGFTLQSSRCVVNVPSPALTVQARQVDPVLLKNVNIII